MSESSYVIGFRKFGICSVDNCSCCSSDKVCRIKPEFGEGGLNSVCSNYFSTVSALEKNREVPRYGESIANLANKHTEDLASSVPNILSVNSELSDNQLYNSYLRSPEFVKECESKSDLDKEVLSPSADFDRLGGRYGSIEIVGRGLPTNDRCGHLRTLKGCLHTELHHNSLVGNYEGKVYVKIVHTWCHNPRCSVCYKRGYAVREAKSAAEVIKAASKTHDSPAEHIIYSPSPNYYALSFDELRLKARKDLVANGVCGGALVFHGFRFRNRKEAAIKHVPYGWTWAPHFHVVGPILGGYSHCRNCKKVKDSSYGKPCEGICNGCSGFESKVRKYGAVQGCIIKVKDARKNIVGTFWYELHHASIDVSKKRFHALTYFGSLSYRKLKVERHRHEDVCPLCQSVLQKVRYFGSVIINTDFNSPLFKRELFMDAFEDGREVFAVFDNGDTG